MPGADPRTFAVLTYPDGRSSFYGADASHAYRVDTVVGSGNPEFGQTVIAGLPDPAGLKLIGEGISVTYALDDGQVYALHAWGTDPAFVVAGADAATFVAEDPNSVDSPTDAHDKNHTYLKGILVK
jgi:hypothetical protein